MFMIETVFAAAGFQGMNGAADAGIFLQEITAPRSRIFQSGLQMLWVRQGRRQPSQLMALRKREEELSGLRPTSSPNVQGPCRKNGEGEKNHV